MAEPLRLLLADLFGAYLVCSVIVSGIAVSNFLGEWVSKDFGWFCLAVFMCIFFGWAMVPFIALYAVWAKFVRKV